MENIYKTPDAELIDQANQEALDYKLYKVSGIGIATLFGTPIAGGLLMSKNYKMLGNITAANQAILYSIIGTLAIIAIAALIPESWNVPSSVFSAPQLVVMILLAKQLQERHILQHQLKGGKLASNWKAFGIGFLVLLALIAIAMPFIAYFVINA